MLSRDIKANAASILSAYQGNTSRQLFALQILFDSTLEFLKKDLLAEAAGEVCQHLHEGPSTKLRCGDCVAVEVGMVTSSLGGAKPPRSAEEDELEAEIKRLIGG